MGRVWAALIGISLVMVLVLPFFLVRGCAGGNFSPSMDLTVKDHISGKIFTIDMEEYLKGVVASELGPAAPLEAYKAQAIAARTYALYRGAGLTTDPETDQAYMSPAGLRKRWGFFSFIRAWNKISRAVAETRGIIMTYDDEPILAAYHANSGGATEDSGLVWGKSLPYLQSRPSPFDRQNTRYRTHIRFTMAEVFNRLPLPGSQNPALLEIVERSETGRVLQVRIDEYTLSGREVRSALNLPSTLFTWEVKDRILHITTWGRGHGVGMSQDGAVYLAQQGYNCYEILKYYYSSIIFSKIY